MSATPAPRADEPSDETLVAAVLDGDDRAFDRLYARHVDRVFRLIARVLGPGGDVEDSTQDTFVRAFRALPTFRGDARWSTFLHRIAVRTAIDHARRRRDVPSGDALEAWLPPSLPEADRAQFRDELAQVWRALARLPAERRAGLILVAVEGMSYAEAAELLESTPDAVKHQVMRVREHLRRALAKGGA